jgi:hypothetical protein
MGRMMFRYRAIHEEQEMPPHEVMSWETLPIQDEGNTAGFLSDQRCWLVDFLSVDY